MRPSRLHQEAERFGGLAMSKQIEGGVAGASTCCCIVVALVALSLSLVWTCIINNRHLFKSTHA